MRVISLAMGHRELDGDSFREWLSRARDEISRSRVRLNEENLYPVADADTGSNMEATIRAAADAVDQENSEQLHQIADAAADGALHGAQGNSGVLLSQIFRGFADGLRENLPKAFALAHERALKAVAEPKDGTILSVARAARDAANSFQTWSGDVRRDAEIALAAWKAARASTIDSATNPPSESSRGTIDAGAHGIELIYRSLVAVLDSDQRDVEDIPVVTTNQSGAKVVKVQSDGAYEVMYDLTNIDNDAIENLRVKLAQIGQSLLIVGEAKFWKVHVHTDFVEEAVALARNIGVPENIRITALDTKNCKKERSLITVANGEGFATLMEASGVDVIRAFDSRRVATHEWQALAGESPEVILIPHDPHGYESAHEAAAQLRKLGKFVGVINSRSPLQAIAAISAHSEGLSVECELEVAEMNEAASRTRSVTIAFAPREMVKDGIKIEEGDVIGLMNQKVISLGKDVTSVAEEAIRKLCDGTTELVTLVTGSNIKDGVVEDLTQRINRSYPAIEVTTYSGGQAWYPLLIGIE